VGTRERIFRKNAVIIQTDIFASLTQAEDQTIALAAQRYGAYLNLPVQLA
jgi:hypothetical protein